MAKALWPDASEDVAANRLRVSLSRLKVALGPILVIDRPTIRLVGADISVDLWELEQVLLEALDEVEPSRQLELLSAHSHLLRDLSWRRFEDIDSSGTLTSWNRVCRKAIHQMAEVASTQKDSKSVELAWQLMCDRGDFEPQICIQFLECQKSSASLEEGFRLIKRVAKACRVGTESARFQEIAQHYRNLSASGLATSSLTPSKCQLIGSALLGKVAMHAESLSRVLTEPDVALHMQSNPVEQLSIFDLVQSHLLKGTSAWVSVELSRLRIFYVLYNSHRVIEISKGLLESDLTPAQRIDVLLYCSFAQFIIRRWDQAMASIQDAGALAISRGTQSQQERCQITKAAYLWHLGKVDEARAIYDSLLGMPVLSNDEVFGSSHALIRLNYGILECVWGEVHEAKHHLELAYEERQAMNFARRSPLLLSVLGFVCAKTGDVSRAVDFSIEGLKLSYGRESSRDGQMNMEWACGVLALSNFRAEAKGVMDWVNEWRIRTEHTRSVCEERYADSLGLRDIDGTLPQLDGSSEYRQVLRLLIKCLRQLQKNTASSLI